MSYYVVCYSMLHVILCYIFVKTLESFLSQTNFKIYTFLNKNLVSYENA